MTWPATVKAVQPVFFTKWGEGMCIDYWRNWLNWLKSSQSTGCQKSSGSRAVLASPSETQRGGMFQREPGDTYGLDNLVAFETKPEPELSV